jgi:hypothetical protein
MAEVKNPNKTSAVAAKTNSTTSQANKWATTKLYSRAVESVIWGTPIVSMYTMREAFFRDAKAVYNDIVYWSKPADWKVQLTTPNAATYYVYANFNTKEGPVVLDFPAAVGAGLFGTLLNAWQVPLADVGPEGDDKGKGGKYLILPPGYQENTPQGYFAVPSETYNGYALFRAIPASSSTEDRNKAIELVKQMRFYPFIHADDPPPQKHIDMAGQLMDGVMKYDETFFDILAKVVDEEPVFARDLVAFAQLRTVGIEKGKAFNPDAATKEELKRAAEDAQAAFIEENTFGIEPFWPGTHWGLHKTIGPETGFSYVFPDKGQYDIEGRGMTFYIAFGAPKKLGAATFYLGQTIDAAGNPLRGEKTYHLHVPANPPAKQYWAVTVYDAVTCCFIKEAPVLALDSYNPDMKRNDDGSVDIYFGPKAPAGKEANWIYTAPNKGWWTYFRFYGPDKALFDKTWKMSDIEEVKPGY